MTNKPTITQEEFDKKVDELVKEAPKRPLVRAVMNGILNKKQLSSYRKFVIKELKKEYDIK